MTPFWKLYLAFGVVWLLSLLAVTAHSEQDAAHDCVAFPLLLRLSVCTPVDPPMVHAGRYGKKRLSLPQEPS